MSIKKTDEGLERVIGVSGLAFTILNFTIGAGIFVLPAIIGIELGAFGIFCYLFCAILLGCIMLVMQRSEARLQAAVVLTLIWLLRLESFPDL